MGMFWGRGAAVAALAGGLAIAAGCGSDAPPAASQSADRIESQAAVAESSPGLSSTELLAMLPTNDRLDFFGWYQSNRWIEEQVTPLGALNDHLTPEAPFSFHTDILRMVTGQSSGPGDEIRGFVFAANSGQLIESQTFAGIYLIDADLSDASLASLFGEYREQFAGGGVAPINDQLNARRLANGMPAVSSSPTLLEMVGQNSALSNQGEFQRELASWSGEYAGGVMFRVSPELRATFDDIETPPGGIPVPYITEQARMGAIGFKEERWNLVVHGRLYWTNTEMAMLLPAMFNGGMRAFRQSGELDQFRQSPMGLPSIVRFIESLSVMPDERNTEASMTIPGGMIGELVTMMTDESGPFIEARDNSRLHACQGNMTRVDSAVQQVILEHNMTDQAAAVQMINDNGGIAWLVSGEQLIRSMPVCPSGGEYTLNPSGFAVTCSHPDHGTPAGNW